MGGSWLTRVLLLRAIGCLFLVAFAVAYNQNPGLIGDSGLTPANAYLDMMASGSRGAGGATRPRKSFDLVGLVASGDGSSLLSPKSWPVSYATFQRCPTLFWLAPRKDLDRWVSNAALLGMALGTLIVLTGSCPMIVMLWLWASYMSIVSIGQRWYGFGWESQLLESSFLAIWLCPVWGWGLGSKGDRLGKFPEHPTPFLVSWGYRWLLLRIMVGAGLIKLRGDQCWRDFTCMEYHYLTQPVPNPLSIFFHHSSPTFHTFEVLVNHFVECVAAFFMFLPQPAAALGGLIQVVFQLTIIVSGNLSFLNWLTILPALACFQDQHLRVLFSKAAIESAAARGAQWTERGKPMLLGGLVPNLGNKSASFVYQARRAVRLIFYAAMSCWILTLSIPVIENLLSPRQAMNTSFDWLKIVNTYGAFGSITKERNEVIIEGYHAQRDVWLEYQFKCKPGDVNRRPCTIAPYHYRLDWLMWFAAFQSYSHNPWLLELSWKMLHSGPESEERKWIGDMMAFDPFANETAPPTQIRMNLYNYQYATGDGGKKTGGKKKLTFHGWDMLHSGIIQPLLDYVLSLGAPRGIEPVRWWTRKKVQEYLPPVGKNHLKEFKSQGYHY